MCKAVVETDLEAGGTKGAGLNDGILYLMSMPYLAILTFGVFYILQKRKRDQGIALGLTLLQEEARAHAERV